MEHTSVGLQKRKLLPDYSLVVIVVLLSGFGLFILHSTTEYTDGLLHGGNTFYTVTKQAIFTGIAITAMMLVSKIDYHILLKYAKYAYPVAITLR